MEKNYSFVIIFCACPTQVVAENLAQQLVTNKLAACVNILPPMTSIYRWKNKIESSGESLMLIKTAANQFEKITQWITKHHPYEVPELIAIPIQQGLPQYLAWIQASLD